MKNGIRTAVGFGSKGIQLMFDVNEKGQPM